MTNLRSSKPSVEGSWVWQQRHALEVLTDVAAETNRSASVRSVYLGLCQLSYMGSPVIETTRAKLCAISGVRYSTLDKANEVMKQAGVVTIERAKVNGLDTGLRYRLLSVPDKREPVLDKQTPVPVATTDKSEEVVVEEMKEMTETSVPSPGGGTFGVSSPKPKSRTQARPLPTCFDEVVAAAELYGYSREAGMAFWTVQQQDGWTIRGRIIFDWHQALRHWCERDAARKIVGDPITHKEFLQFVTSEGLNETSAEDFWRALKRQGGRLLNKRNGRREPVMNVRAAFRAFVASEVNQILEEKGLR